MPIQKYFAKVKNSNPAEIEEVFIDSEYYTKKIMVGGEHTHQGKIYVSASTQELDTYNENILKANTQLIEDQAISNITARYDREFSIQLKIDFKGRTTYGLLHGTDKVDNRSYGSSRINNYNGQVQYRNIFLSNQFVIDVWNDIFGRSPTEEDLTVIWLFKYTNNTIRCLTIKPNKIKQLLTAIEGWKALINGAVDETHEAYIFYYKNQIKHTEYIYSLRDTISDFDIYKQTVESYVENIVINPIVLTLPEECISTASYRK